jgi:hypothetical protein
VSLSTLEFDALNAGFAACKMIIATLQPQLAHLQQVYDSAGGVKDTLEQGDLDSMPVFSGLTKAQADDGFYALTTVLLPAITQSYGALSQMASRDRGGLPMPYFPPTPPAL